MTTDHKRVSLTQQAHDFISTVLFSGAVVIDATAGKGFDTSFLAERVGDSGRVYAFDIQHDALAETQKTLALAGTSDQVTLIHANHILMQEHIPERCFGHIQAVMFNLGYLPGFSHVTITQSDETLMALQHAVDMLAPKGRISILAYTGHVGGRQEADVVKTWAQALAKDKFKVEIEIPAWGRSSPPEWIKVIKEAC